jgi:hypothetical protein
MCKMDFEGRRLLEEKTMRQDFILEENQLKLWIRLEWTIRRESIGRLEGGSGGDLEINNVLARRDGRSSFS